MKNFIPLSIKIKNATKLLKENGYVVISDDDEKFAILAERKKILCNSPTDFFNKVLELTENKEASI